MFDQIRVDGSLQIRYWDDPVLQTVCDPVTEFGPELEAFGHEMLEVMRTAPPNGGVGLAAPQIGLAKRFFVMVRDDNTLPPIIAANAEIVTYGEDIPHLEGCLSVPGIQSQVIRPRFTTLKYQHPATGEHLQVELESKLVKGHYTLEAFCAQHEVDHCDGIMFFDSRRVSRQVNRNAERMWEKERRKWGI